MDNSAGSSLFWDSAELWAHAYFSPNLGAFQRILLAAWPHRSAIPPDPISRSKYDRLRFLARSDSHNVLIFLHLWSSDKKATQLCPCGFYGDTQQHCRCSPAQIQRYRAKISGPLLDRIDLHVGVARLPINQLVEKNPNDHDKTESNSQQIKKLVLKAHQIQQQRQQKLNAHLESTELTQANIIDPEALNWLSKAMEKVGISARAFHRLLKVARTIADLELAEKIIAQQREVEDQPAMIKHVKEALAFRPVKADHPA